MLAANPTQLSLPDLRVLFVRRLPRHSPSAKNHLQPHAAHSSDLTTKSLRIRTSAKHTHNPFRSRTFKTKGLKPFRICIYKKTGGVGLLLLTRNPTKDFCPERPSGVRDLSFHPTIEHLDPAGRSPSARYVITSLHHCVTLLHRRRPHNAQPPKMLK